VDKVTSTDAPLERDERTRHLERQLAVAQQITHIGSWEWSPTTNAVSWSDELYRIYGLEPQSCEITFESFLSRLHPEDRGRIQTEVARAFERGGRFAYHERIVRPDGTVRHLETVGEARVDDGARVTRLIGTCRDVTDERKRDEAILLFSHIVENVQIALTVWCVSDATLPSSATLIAFNPAATALVERPLDSCIGKSLAEVLGVGARELESSLTSVQRTGGVFDVAEFHLRPGDTRTYSVKAFPLPGDCVGLSFDDITVQTRSKRLKEAEQRVLEQIAAGSPLPAVLTQLALMIEEQAPPTIASIMLLDESGTFVRTGAAPHLPAEYNRAIENAPIGPSAGSCGTAAFLKEPVFVSDIETDPRWGAYRELARRFRLRACWSTPVLSDDRRVLGTFALYYRDPRAPSEAERELIARVTHLAGIAIHRTQLDERMRALSAHIEAIREDERTSIAREIHDELGQALTALKMDIAWLARQTSESDWRARLEEMSKMSDELIDVVRRISAALRPGVLDDLGLVAAFEWQAQEFHRRTGTTFVVHANVTDERFDRDVSTGLFRIFQEALTNVARHAAATFVDVRLDFDDGRLSLRMKDNGKGIPNETAARPSSLGLLGMAERARRLGGTLEIKGEPGQGSLVAVDVPAVIRRTR
jgi:PAS domain S-box-containing protein